MRLVQKEVVAMPARQTDAVEILAELKNRIQCAAMINPVPINLAMNLGDISSGISLNLMMINNPNEARNVL
jgi:hypothetical protein